jgi:CheY-like chemotaxis protein
MSEKAQRILVAEDNPTIAGVLTFCLRQAGYDVTHASCGQSAWDLLCQESYDLVTTDFQMPRMTGGELCQRIRAEPRLAKLPVILLTCKGYELDTSRYLDELGVSRIIAKPFSPNALVKAVKQCLETNLVTAQPQDSA